MFLLKKRKTATKLQKIKTKKIIDKKKRAKKSQSKRQKTYLLFIYIMLKMS